MSGTGKRLVRSLQKSFSVDNQSNRDFEIFQISISILDGFCFFPMDDVTDQSPLKHR